MSEPQNIWGRSPHDPEWHQLVETFAGRTVATACRLSIEPSSTYAVDRSAGPFATPVTGKSCAACVDSIRLADVMARVSAAFEAYTTAHNKFNRCTREDSRAIASAVYREAEAAYRKVATERDRFIEEMRARQTRRGGHPTRSHDGPIVEKDTP